MVVTEYFDTRPEADAYAAALRGCRVRVSHVRTPVRGYSVIATYTYDPIADE